MVEPARPTTTAMRRMLAVAAVLVFAIGLPLYLLPDRTETLFSWTVSPPLTAAFLGAGYLAAVPVEYLASRKRTWADARIGVPAVWVFTTLTLILTLRHLDPFHFGGEFDATARFVAWGWLIVYVVVSPVLAVLWIRQVRVPGGDPPHTAVMPAGLRMVLAIQGVPIVVLGAGLYLAPGTFDALWPWQLSALTGGAVGAWLVGIGTAALHSVVENDLRRVRPAMIAYLLFGILQIGAVARFAGADGPSGEPVLDWSHARIWVYLVVLAAIVVSAASALWLTSRTTERSTR